MIGNDQSGLWVNLDYDFHGHSVKLGPYCEESCCYPVLLSKHTDRQRKRRGIRIKAAGLLQPCCLDLCEPHLNAHMLLFGAAQADWGLERSMSPPSGHYGVPSWPHLFVFCLFFVIVDIKR